MAEQDRNFIAIEGQETVILRALEKTAAACGRQIKNDKIQISEEQREIPNLKFVCAFVNEMSEFFREGQLTGIYLNFSDPWPKARHAKRRLTYRERLKDYAWALKDGGFIEIKTDNDGLFEFTLEEIAAEGYDILEMSRDLHNSAYAADNVMTEYEARFSENGKTINYVKIAL
jgi:tRNA (guanine-N7-)-methyltransferase